MNEMMAMAQAPLTPNGPAWLTLSFVLIALGIAIALLIFFWGSRLSRRRRYVREELEERGELAGLAEQTSARPITPPIAAAPSPPPIADAPVPASAPIETPAPEPEPLADEPIAAAAPFDASPATLAASQPAPEPAPAPAPVSNDDLTRMKGVGPRLADRLHMLGITGFAQIAALSPEEADALDARMGDFQGRIHRDRWIEQAAFLAAGDIAGYEAVFGKL